MENITVNKTLKPPRQPALNKPNIPQERNPTYNTIWKYLISRDTPSRNKSPMKFLCVYFLTWVYQQ